MGCIHICPLKLTWLLFAIPKSVVIKIYLNHCRRARVFGVMDVKACGLKVNSLNAEPEGQMFTSEFFSKDMLKLHTYNLDTRLKQKTTITNQVVTNTIALHGIRSMKTWAWGYN